LINPELDCCPIQPYAQNPQEHMPRHIEGPRGYPGGPNGPAAVLQDTRRGATWNHAVSHNPAVLDQILCRTPYQAAVALATVLSR
jgi:hypothetical protein